jgi:hypothetical protein
MAGTRKGGRRRAQVARSGDVVGYIRVSTDGQAESGAGLAAQRSAIRAECERRGFELAHIYEDAGASAKSLDGREALAEALQALAEGGASVLVVAKLDRLARSVADFAELVRRAERQGWAILACDLGVDMTTPTGGLLANVTASVAEWERRIIGCTHQGGSCCPQGGWSATRSPSVGGRGARSSGSHGTGLRSDPAGHRRPAERRGDQDAHRPELVACSRAKDHPAGARRGRSVSPRPFWSHAQGSNAVAIRWQS